MPPFLKGDGKLEQKNISRLMPFSRNNFDNGNLCGNNGGFKADL